jgi:hypothetical protein
VSELWLILGVCLVFVAGAALPLLKDKEETKIPKKETLRDWRSEE